MRYVPLMSLMLLALALGQVAFAYGGGKCDTKITEYPDGYYTVTCLPNGCTGACSIVGVPQGGHSYSTCSCSGVPIQCNEGSYVDPDLGLITGCVNPLSCPTGFCSGHSKHFQDPDRIEDWCTCE